MFERRWRIIVAGLGLACWTVGCSSPSPPDDAGTDAGDADVETDADAETDADQEEETDADQEVEPELPCLDSDGDGYGVNCPLGLDCDDSDAEVWTTCGGRDPCARLHAGCPCDEEGAEVICRTESPLDTIDGDELCYAGTRVCAGGVWSACSEMTFYPFEEDEARPGSGGGAYRQPVLGFPEDCPGRSCDRECSLVHDCLSAPDLHGDRSENLAYDLMGSPPAVVLGDTGATGLFHRPIESDCASYEVVEWYALVPTAHVEEPGMVVIRVRAADTESGLASVEWVEVVRCPGGSCDSPEHPTDRDFAEGNLRRWLGDDGVHRTWLEIEVTLSAGGGDRSPRYVGHELYYFCDPASE